MDSMSEFNGLFMTIVLVFFPILIYLVLCCYIGLKKQKYAKFLFMLTVITSLYLCMRSTGKIDNCNLINRSLSPFFVIKKTIKVLLTIKNVL